MKKLQEKYIHEKTGIEIIVDYKEIDKEIKTSISLISSMGREEFIFRNSKPKTLIEVGKALIEIGEFNL